MGVGECPGQLVEWVSRMMLRVNKEMRVTGRVVLVRFVEGEDMR